MTAWQDNRRSGLCGRCGKHPPEPGKARCSGCLAYAEDQRNKRKEELRHAGLCTACGHLSAQVGSELCADCLLYHRTRPNRREQAREYRQRLRDEVFTAYGGYECVCCGETERLFLTIDHIESDAHWRSLSLTGFNFYRTLKREGFPDGFQVLCASCNLGKSLNGGVECPHETRRIIKNERPSAHR